MMTENYPRVVTVTIVARDSYREDDPIQEYVPPKLQPFWTKQGKHKKGKRSRY